MNQISETPIYEKADIKITNLRAVFGAKTYSISNITSVEAQRIDPSGCAPAFFILGGILLTAVGAMAAMDGSYGILIFGLCLLIPGYFISRQQKPSYAVSLTTASGEVKAYTSENQETIQEIVNALNEAIIRKG